MIGGRSGNYNRFRFNFFPPPLLFGIRSFALPYLTKTFFRTGSCQKSSMILKEIYPLPDIPPIQLVSAMHSRQSIKGVGMTGRQVYGESEISGGGAGSYCTKILVICEVIITHVAATFELTVPY